MLSIIIPTYNEENNIESTINSIKQFSGNAQFEIIIADGGSTDNTIDLARFHECQVIDSKKGRGAQLNVGARAATGNLLLFLHADTILPNDFITHINNSLYNENTTGSWGRFDVKLSGKHFLFRIIEKMISLRSRFTGIATGDQAIFVDRETFFTIGGYKNIPLMEDIELSKRLKRLSSPVCLKQYVITSSRRWEDNGIIRTVLLMWLLRFLYLLGVSPNFLKRFY